MWSLLFFSLFCNQTLGEIAHTLQSAIDKSSYQEGAYSAAKQLSTLHSIEAAELRIKLFDQKLNTYRGVFLRDWFYSGYRKACNPEEIRLMANEAANRNQSDWHRVLLLQALATTSSTLPADILLNRSFLRSPPAVKRAWIRTICKAWSNHKLDCTKLNLGRWQSPESLLRNLAIHAGCADGFLYLPTLSSKEINYLIKLSMNTKSPENASIAIRALARHEESQKALLSIAPRVFFNPACGPRTAFLESAEEFSLQELIPFLVEAMQEEAERSPNRYTADIGHTLRQLSGQSFGDAPGFWEKWLHDAQEPGQQSSFVPIPFSTSNRSRNQTISSFFGLALETTNLVLLVDGSGSMRASKLGDLSCVEAAAVEANHYLQSLPPSAKFQVIVIEDDPITAFKKLVPVSMKNRKKAMRFLRSREYMHTSALLDALEVAASDPLVDTLLLVSDGGSSAGKHQHSQFILDAVHQLHQRTGVRIHTILVTDSAKHARFMKQLAESTGGRMVRPKSIT